MPSSPKILIVRLGAMGDVVRVLPVLPPLRRHFPEAHLAWLVERPWDSVVRGHPMLDEVIVLERRRWQQELRGGAGAVQVARQAARVLAELRRRRFDLVFDFHGNLRSGVLTRATGAPRRVGYARRFCREGNFLFTTEQVGLESDRINRVEKALALLTGIGIEVAGAEPIVTIPPELVTRARSFVEALPGEGPLVIVHPGVSAFGRYKQWPPADYATVCGRLADELGARVVVTWGPGERELAEQMAGQASPAAAVAPETPSVKDLAALLHQADLFIGADSGPMHLAAALRVPVVALFGPKDPAIHAPYGTKHEIVEVPLDCRPCRRRRCDDPRCVTLITPDQVFDAADRLLDGKPK